LKKSTYKYKEPPPLGELTDSIHINVGEIPDHVRDELAAATLDMVRNILAQPGGREMLDAKTRERKERQSDTRTPLGQGANDGAETVNP
jgi:hypothetical protein